MNERLSKLASQGVSIWLDDLSRDRLDSGGLARLISESSVTGVTTNPSIFAAAISSGDAYAEQLAGLGDATVIDAITELTTTDVRMACDLFRPVYDASGGEDGRVSIEVDPRLARELDATVNEAATLHAIVGRENVLIKIPATVEGLGAIRRAIAAGISVNVTLIFAIERYLEVAEAYLEGLEDADAQGLDLSTIHSVASVFVSRVDTEVDARLEALGTPDATALLGTAAIANARLIYAQYLAVFGSERFAALKAKGAHAQRPLWASTGVKNPAYPDTRYVVELVAPGTVNTMPEKTMQAVADHGEVTGDTITPHLGAAADALDRLAQVGVDIDDVTRTLESKGVDAFVQSWNELIETVSERLERR